MCHERRQCAAAIRRTHGVNAVAIYAMRRISDDTLCFHSIEDLLEAGDIGACHVVAFHAVLLGSGVDVVIDVDHDALELLVDFLECPGQTLGVLAHFQCGGSYAAGVGCLAGNEENAVLLQVLGRLEGGGHVCAFADCVDTVGNECLRVIEQQLVLGRAGKCDVDLDGPDTLAFVILSGGPCSLVLGQACALDFLDFLKKSNIDAFGIIDPAGGIRAGDDLCAKLLSLLDRIGGNVACAGDGDSLAFKAGAVILEELLGQVDQTIAGSLGSCQGAAVGEALAGQNAFIEGGDSLVLAAPICL